MKEIPKITHAEILGIISAWFIMIGAFLPWAYVFCPEGIDCLDYQYNYLDVWMVTGFEICTGFTLFFGIICFLLFYYKSIGKYKTFLGVLLLGILILFLVLSSSVPYTSDYIVEYSYGYYLTLFGSIGLLISAVWLFIDTYESDKK